MVNNVTIEQMFANTYSKYLQKEIESHKEFITLNALPQEEYLVQVGKVQALSLVKDKFDRLKDETFGRES